MQKVSNLTQATLVKKEAQARILAKRLTRLCQEKGLQTVPDEQLYFWSPQWQAMEGEADRALASGDYETLSSVEELIKALEI